MLFCIFAFARTTATLLVASLLLPVTVEEISLQQGPTLLLAGPIVFRFIFVVSVAVVPRRSVGLPGSQTDPAEVRLASLVLADHVVAATVLLYGGVTLQRTIQ